VATADPARAGLTVRCAIYTRKSSDEGLEQEFNSLDAQREAQTAEPARAITCKGSTAVQ
jgi:site-specific DNA recombinase